MKKLILLLLFIPIVSCKQLSKIYYPKGNIKEVGFIQKNNKEGLWKYYDEDGVLSKMGKYKNGKEDGLWEEYLNGKILQTYYYKLGKLEGNLTTYYTEMDENFKSHPLTQIEIKVTYTNNKLNGIYEDFYIDGKHSEIGLYVNGIEEGEWKTFWDNGQLQSIRNYLQGKLNGKYLYYYKDGRFWKEEFYENGIKI